MPDPGADTVKIPQAGRSFWQRVAVWTLGTLGALCLLVGSGWLACRWFLQASLSRMAAELKGEIGDPASIIIMDVVRQQRICNEFAYTDRLPDFIVYPFLESAVRRGGYQEMLAALEVAEARAYGGCREGVPEHGFRSGQPVPGAAKWITRFPRQIVEDVAVLGGGGFGTSLYGVGWVETHGPLTGAWLISEGRSSPEQEAAAQRMSRIFRDRFKKKGRE